MNAAWYYNFYQKMYHIFLEFSGVWRSTCGADFDACEKIQISPEYMKAYISGSGGSQISKICDQCRGWSIETVISGHIWGEAARVEVDGKIIRIERHA